MKTETRGVRAQDSFGVPAVKLQTVVSWPTSLSPIPATCNTRLSPESMRRVVPGSGLAGGTSASLAWFDAHAGDGAGDVRAVVLDRLRRVVLRGRLVVEHLGGDDLVVGELAVAELVLRRVARVVEAGVGEVDAGVDDGDLDACSRSRRAPAAAPGRDGAD